MSIFTKAVVLPLWNHKRFKYFFNTDKVFGKKRRSYNPLNITIRRPDFVFPENIEKFWHSHSALKTHVLNSFSLLFPQGEKFFIKSISKVLKNIKDPDLKKAAKAFMGQEGSHYVEHEKFYDNLRKQGYQIDPLLKVLEAFTDQFISKIFTDKINLSITAGLEHYTALLSEICFKENFMENANESMKDLFEWHAAEEIEHRAVAFDVLQEIDDSYPLRLFGMWVATLLLFTSASAFTVDLLRQDKKLLDPQVYKDFFDTFFLKEKTFIKSARIFIRYFKLDFHPEDEDLKNIYHHVFERLLKNGNTDYLKSAN